MRKTKAKRGAFWCDQMLPFVLVWMFGIGLVNLVSRMWPTPFFSAEEKVTLSLFAIVVLTGLMQVTLVERLLGRSMRRWMWYTIPGALITLFLNAILPSLYFDSNSFLRTLFETYNPLTNLALNAPLPLLQFFWLQRRVKHAWLWPLLTIPLLMASTAIPYGVAYYQIVRMIPLLCAGVAQAGLMHYFWQHPKDDEKAKHDSAIDNDLDDSRIERLQERDHEADIWNQGRDQGLQSDTR